jgi:parallel beta-helix repeat protein
LVAGAEIGLRAAKSRVELEDCTFAECGKTSLSVAGGAEVSMKRCAVEDGHRIGVECSPGSALHMTDSRVTNLTTYGVVLKEVANTSFVRASQIERCGWDGVLVRGRCSPTIDGCEIRGNGRHGVQGVEGGSLNVVNTRVADNTGAGIRLQERWDGTLDSNTISGNCSGGIVAEIRCGGKIVRNQIESNNKMGAYLRLDCTPSVVGNQFIRNKGVGLHLENSRPKTIQDNQFIANESAALRHEGGGSIDVSGNWWGTADEQAIARMIEDQDDNPSWGRAKFQPFLSKPPTTPE